MFKDVLWREFGFVPIRTPEVLYNLEARHPCNPVWPHRQGVKKAAHEIKEVSPQVLQEGIAAVDRLLPEEMKDVEESFRSNRGDQERTLSAFFGDEVGDE